MKRALVLIMLLVASIAMGQTMATMAMDQQTAEVRASWTAPITGSPVVTYVLQLSRDGEPFETYATTDTTTVIMSLDVLHEYIARVAGVDALDRQGPWSEPSSPYLVDPGPPGSPGTVVWTD